ncbi:MAG: hypothetical protein ACFFDT_30450 [Candidatus Hodarchaeota archaeon]
MTSHEEPEKLSHKEGSKRRLPWQRYGRDLLDFALGFKNAVIVIFAWILISEIAGYSILDLVISIISLMLYPLNLLLFNTGFSDINVPEVFFLLIPLVTLIVVGFLIIISTED